MKRTIMMLLLAVIAVGTRAADEVTFEFDGGIEGTLKTRMEQQIARLLTAINRAESSGSEGINFSGIQFESSQMANQTLTMLWNSVHFRTQDDDFFQPCLRHRQGSRVTGYQVRGIYMDMIPVDDSYQEDRSQEFVIELDAQGRISDVNIAMNKVQYETLMKEGKRLDDLDRMEQIISFCEQFRMAYNKMDIDFMEDIFSEDALIITGRVRQKEKATITLKNPEVNLPPTNNVEYTTQTKGEYISNLRNLFRRQKGMKGGFINVKFDEYRVVRHPAKPNYFGVTLKQSWNSKGYHDEGIVFLVWDFTNEEKPKIQVRTWQNMATEERDIFTLNNFKLR